MKVNLEVGNIADNLNNCEEFAITARGLREIILLPSWKGTSQKQDGKSKVATSWRPNTERFEENERRTEANTQKRQPDIENEKRKLKK